MKYFECQKCHSLFLYGGNRIPFKCGAVVDYLVADDPGVGNDNDIFASQGLKPLGCGGEIKQVTKERAEARTEALRRG